MHRSQAVILDVLEHDWHQPPNQGREGVENLPSITRGGVENLPSIPRAKPEGWMEDSPHLPE